VLEKHFRLTAYCLPSDYIPDKIEIILGVSKTLKIGDCINQFKIAPFNLEPDSNIYDLLM
jgi:hypothetical protein